MAATGGSGTDDGRARRALGLLDGMLTEGETIEAVAVQHRLFALTHPRKCIAATSGRFISLDRHWLGGYDAEDVRWQDLKETHIRAGIIAAELTLVARASSDMNLSMQPDRVLVCAGLCKDQAQAMYRICQQHDQVWREKRRVRELEELRAKSGGVQISGGPPLSAEASGGGGGTAGAGDESQPARRLRQAREMLDAKLITDSEYESIKAKIISSI